MSQHIFETSRLILRELNIQDATEMFLLDSNPEVHRYLGNKPIKTIEESLKIIEFVQAQYKNYGIGRWAVIHKETNEFIGWSGIKYNPTTTNGVSNYYDLGYRFRQEFWGNGYALESAKACLKFGFDILQLPALYAAAHQSNIASNKILNKIGFKNIGNFMYEHEPEIWYKIDNSELNLDNVPNKPVVGLRS